MVKNESSKPRKVKEVIAYVKGSGGIEYATQTMNQFHQQANEILHGLPESVYRTSLQQLVKFTIERKN